MLVCKAIMNITINGLVRKSTWNQPGICLEVVAPQ